MEWGMKRSNFFFLWEEKLQGDGLGVLLISQQIMICNDIIRSAQIENQYYIILARAHQPEENKSNPFGMHNFIQYNLNTTLLIISSAFDLIMLETQQNQVSSPKSTKTHSYWPSLSLLNCSTCRLCRIYYNMNMCQHGQKITKFCITEHCHHKQSAGCEYCIRKYHFHLTNTLILTEPDVDTLIKNITLPTDIKFKSRTLQQTAIEYLRNIKLSFNNWIDQAQNTIADRLGHPTLRKNNLLSTYDRLKHKEYRKITAKDLRLINQFSKSVTPETLKKKEIGNYYEQVDWTANLLETIEKVVADLTELPEVKQGEGTIQVISKVKLNQIYESIKKEKEKRDLQSKTTGIQSISTNQGLKLEDNALLKRRQSNEKNQSSNNTSANQVKASLDNKNTEKLPEEAEKPAFLVQRQNSAKQSSLNNSNNENAEETKKGLRRRRSSIDDKMELRFGNLTEDKCKQDKEMDQKKRRIIERIGQQKQRAQSQQKVEARKGIGRQVSIKVRQDENTIANLLNLKYANKKEQTKKQQPPSSQTSKQTTNLDKSQNTDLQRSEVSSSKASDRNVLGMMELLINNILPPLPLTAPKNTMEETITEKVVKIPIPAMNQNQVADQIQSPIFKSRRRQQDRDKQGNQNNPFGIILMPATDKAVEKVNEALLKPIPQSQPVEQVSVPTIIKGSSKQNEKPQPKPSQKVQEKQDELIVLEKSQKNSLLLFSQALKSPGDRAIELLKAALKYSSQNLSAAQYLSYLYLEGGKAKQCIEVCQSILVKIQDTPEQFQLTLHLHNNKAAALNQLGRYSESIMILEKCLRFRRKHYFYKNLGDAYFSLGITQKASMNYEKAIKLDPQSDQALYNLAVTQYIQQEYTSAQLSIKQALKIQPMNQTYIQFSQQIEKRLSNLVM